MTGELQHSISALYQAFAAYRTPKAMDACACCIDGAANSRLLSRSLRQLSSDDLSHYSRKAMTTWGTQTDFKHFLPRLLELLALEPESGIYLDMLIGKLEYADYLHWPDDEKEAICTFILAVRSDGLSKYPYHIPIDELVLSLARTGDKLHEFLIRWIERGDRTAIYHLADFVQSVSFKLDANGTPILIDATPETAKQLRDWLVSREVLERLQEAFITEGNGELANSLSDAEHQISWMRAASRK